MRIWLGLFMSRDIPRNWLAPLLILLVLGSVTAYLSKSNIETHATNSYDPKIFGMGEPLMARSIWEKGIFSLQPAFDALKYLNVTRLREWTWMSLLLVDETTVNATNKEVLDAVVSNMSEINVTILGVVQDCPNWMTGIYGIYDTQAVPNRNTTSGSNYMHFLQKYNESWKTLVEAFPSITMWEIGNEYNANDFLHGYDEASNSAVSFTDLMRTDILVDLLYYGSSGIHHGNPNATTVLGGLAEADSKSIGVITNSLRDIYEDIEGRGDISITNSTDPDDYFQVACWHPYLFNVTPTFTSWVVPNNEVHQVMVNHGDSDKRVIFSEFGYRDVNDNTPEEVARYLNETFQLASESLPWLDTIYWFRLVDPSPETVGDINPAGYGIINLNWTRKPAADSYRNLILSVVPEYPIAIVLPLIIAATLVVVVIYKRRQSILSHL